MQDMRFVSGDQESLTLETKDGERFSLTVDDAVRAAIKTTSANPSSATLSPREIQDAIRSGASIAELVASSGDSVDFVTKFATPVLEELAHMVSSALAIRVEIAPDRFNEAQHREFGELISERLQNGGASSIVWSASRLNATTWQITANFETMGGLGQAVWNFDPRKFTLSPENETAIGLSSQSGFGDAPIPKLKALTPVAPVEPVAEPAPASSEPTALLDAFKERREAAAASIETVEIVEEIGDNLIEDVVEEVIEEVEPEPTPEVKKGRAPMPSWDEIVFGTKSEDQEN